MSATNTSSCPGSSSRAVIVMLSILIGLVLIGFFIVIFLLYIWYKPVKPVKTNDMERGIQMNPVPRPRRTSHPDPLADNPVADAQPRQPNNPYAGEDGIHIRQQPFPIQRLVAESRSLTPNSNANSGSTSTRASSRGQQSQGTDYSSGSRGARYGEDRLGGISGASNPHHQNLGMPSRNRQIDRHHNY